MSPPAPPADPRALGDGETPAVPCPHCGELLDLDALHRDAAAAESGQAPAELVAALPPPDGVIAREEGGGLMIRWRWFRPRDLFLLLFALVWDSFLVVWYGIALTSFVAGDGESLIALLFPVLHVAAGVFITWRAVAGLVNKTTITARGGRLRVHHGPVPWSRPPELATEDLDQLFVAREVGSKGGVTWLLMARTVGGEAVKLIGELRDLRHGQYVERRLESFLGIGDRRVPDEYRRG